MPIQIPLKVIVIRNKYIYMAYNRVKASETEHPMVQFIQKRCCAGGAQRVNHI